MSQVVLPDQQQSQSVVRRLIEHIKSESLSVGDRLPSIRQLATKMSLSPNVIRDAMVQAQTMGLVELRPRSGAYIRSLDYAPLVDVLTDTLVTSLMQNDHSLFYLLESRELMEVELVSQAARRRRLEDLLPVREALDAMTKVTNEQADQSTKFVDADVAFHLEIARIAGNPVLLAFLKAVLELLRPHLVSFHQSFKPEVREWTDRSHAAIYDALVEGDIELARREIHEHVGMAARNLVEKENNSITPDSGSKSEGAVE